MIRSKRLEKRSRRGIGIGVAVGFEIAMDIRFPIPTPTPNDPAGGRARSFCSNDNQIGDPSPLNSRICQTFAAFPAEPGDLPTE